MTEFIPTNLVTSKALFVVTDNRNLYDWCKSQAAMHTPRHNEIMVEVCEMDEYLYDLQPDVFSNDKDIKEAFLQLKAIAKVYHADDIYLSMVEDHKFYKPIKFVSKEDQHESINISRSN